MKLMRKHIFVGFLAMIFLFSIGGQSAMGAGGTTGSLEVGSTSAFDGAIVAVRCYDLEVSSTYVVNMTGDIVGFSFTTGAAQTEYTVYLTVDKPATTETVYIWLHGDGAALDTYTLQVKDDSLIPDEFLISLGITLLVLFLIVGIVKRMRK